MSNMGNKDKKKSRHRSRSRSRDRDMLSHKEKKDRKRAYSSESSEDSSDSSSSDKRYKKKHKDRARSRSQDHSRERSRSRSKSKKKKKRAKSKERRPKEKRQLTPAELERLKEERQKEKELLKALETPEEKRARRMGKKEAKERKRKEEMGWDEEYMGYTNSDNPFGDEHLLDTFVWSKKMEKEGKKNMTKGEMMTHQKQKMVETKVELEKVKKRRIEREREMEEREREREREQRDKEIEYFREWEMQEDTFHLNQAKLRSKIRIDDGRAKPIDLLAKYISMEDDDFSVEMHEPYTYLNGLTIQDLEDLLEDIKVYVELEMGKNVDYWRDITIISEDELNKLRKIDPDNSNFVGERRSGINQSVMEDVSSVFKGKTLNQLQLLELQINSKLKGGEGVDIGYWESLLQQLGAHMARQRLRERHQEQLRSKLFKLKQQQGIESAPLFPIIKTENSDSDGGSEDGAAAIRAEPMLPPAVREEMPSGSGSPQVSSNLYVPERPKQLLSPPREDEPEPSTSEDKNDDEDEVVLTEESLLEQRYEEYDAGNYSPRFLRVSELEADTIVYEAEDDLKRLEYARRHALSTGRAKDDVEEMFEKKAREGMDSDEAQFSVEVPLEKQTLLWSDKYRPRKPRFFNRVHTGFEWNKYNQTHYDIDNPPPKIVQGYKFNIFYPDLIDKAKTPEYTLTPCEDNKDFAVLRFHAGPPYEDIGFKIVNREWEFSYKRGFRCQFHNNIFQLWFHFKRYRYRR